MSHIKQAGVGGHGARLTIECWLPLKSCICRGLFQISRVLRWCLRQRHHRLRQTSENQNKLNAESETCLSKRGCGQLIIPGSYMTCVYLSVTYISLFVLLVGSFVEDHINETYSFTKRLYPLNSWFFNSYTDARHANKLLCLLS